MPGWVGAAEVEEFYMTSLKIDPDQRTWVGESFGGAQRLWLIGAVPCSASVWVVLRLSPPIPPAGQCQAGQTLGPAPGQGSPFRTCN